MHKPEIKHYGVLLAGGRSSRMGSDKAELKRGNELMMDYGIRQLQGSLCKTTWINRNRSGYLQDIYPDKGPISGIHTALNQINENENAFLTVLPIDMPFITKDLLIQLQLAASQKDYPLYFETSFMPFIIPVTSESKDYCLNVVHDKKPASIWQMFVHFDARSLKQYDEKQFINTNTPQEWQAIECKITE